ncbi:MAG: MBL fold metallo-hydrolase [Candidatus Omnitrophica bacterium]|nr:MBL fold metallo-hydrolase [Candidatus Omnitrophota bacterium]
MRRRVMTTMLAMVALVPLAFGETGPVHGAIPDVAKGVSIPHDKGYVVQEIGEDLYWVTDGFYQSMFLTTGKGVIVVDAPPSLGEKLMRAIRDVTQEPVVYVVYSHSHADHIGSASMFPKTAKVVAQKQTKVRLDDMRDPKRPFPFGIFVGGKPVPMPTVTFDKSYTIKLGRQTLKLDYLGDDHEPGNLFIYAPKQKVLMKIDIVFPGWSPFAGLAIAENINGYYRAVDQILSYDFDTLVTGHWGRLGTRHDVEVQREYVQDLRANAGKALQTVNFYAVAQKTGMDDLALLFDTYLREVTQACAEATIPAWKDRLGGVEILTPSHCYQVIMALRVD